MNSSRTVFLYLIAYEFHYQGHLFTRGLRIHEQFTNVHELFSKNYHRRDCELMTTDVGYVDQIQYHD